MKNFKILWGVIIFLLITLAMIGRRFVEGDIASSDDGRIAVILSSDERNFVLAEMRKFLVITQAVSEAITNKDLELAAKFASRAGMQADKNTPGSLLTKIPLSMKRLGFDTHQKFDQIASDAVRVKDLLHSRNQLDELLKNCIACHASYKIVEANN